MAKMYLLNPPFLPGYNRQLRGEGMVTRGGTLYYPIWLAYAAGVLQKAGSEVRLVDAVANGWDAPATIEDIRRFAPSAVVIDSNFASMSRDLSFARMVKEATGALVAMVGPPSSQYADFMLARGPDLVVRMEYDLTLRDLAAALSQGSDYRDVPGLTYREGDGTASTPDQRLTTSADLDDMPFVSAVYKEHLDIGRYYLSSSIYPLVQVFSGRGCPNRCTFCSWPQTLMGRKYRARSVESVIEEMGWVEKNLPQVKEVFFEDDTFTLDRSRVREFCRQYGEKGLDIAWACNARATLDYETMRAMRKANCRMVIVGYESGSDGILKNIKKGVSVDQNIRFSQDARRSGLLVHGDFIVGLPGETNETIQQTRELIRTTRPDLLQVQIASPLPGTEFFRWAQENGNLVSDRTEEYLDGEGHQRPMVRYPGLPPEDIGRAADQILSDYYRSVRYVPLALKQVLRSGGWDEMRRLWRSMTVFREYSKEREQ